ncbi:unnamed protein product [Linum trigynum]|uniref:Reverse transcriptase zinc-binding domain-containing protein n=1 Tax=Linum trigynum TaxID=586398 RepID=A0AAV2ESC9_9ROSI
MHRMRSSMWLVNQRKLLTNAERKRKHLTNDDGCKICGGGPETTLHVLCDCPYARATWAEALQNEPDHDDFFEPNIERWMLHYTTTLSSRLCAAPSTTLSSRLCAACCGKAGTITASKVSWTPVHTFRLARYSFGLKPRRRSNMCSELGDSAHLH